MQPASNSVLNGTVLGAATLRTSLPVAALSLTLLFAAIEPAASSGLALPGRLVFWAVHVSLGLLGIYAASLVIRQAAFSRWPPWLAVLVTGVLGTVLVAPLYLAAELIVPLPASEEPDDWLDFFAARGPGQALVAEIVEVLPVFLLAWVVINLPALVGGTGRDSGNANDPEPPEGGPSSPAGDERARNGEQQAFVARLPDSIGTGIVAVSSDLHYLHVHTTAGRAMIIGNLRDVALAFNEEGMLVHKSHWVAHDQVVRYVASGREAHCLMTNGRKIPVSRRRRAEVKAMYGDRSTARLSVAS